MKIIFLLVALLLVLDTANAGISKCKKPDGSYFFSDSGCQGSDLIEKTDKKITQPQGNQYTKGVASAPYSSCSAEDKRQANEHFATAEQIINSRVHNSDQSKDRQRWYDHEMMVGKMILTSCQGPMACRNTSKSEAKAHLMRAKVINDSKAHSYSQKKDRSNRYEHEMTIARNILSSCSGSTMPGTTTIKCKSKSSITGQVNTSHYYGQSHGTVTGVERSNTTCTEQ